VGYKHALMVGALWWATATVGLAAQPSELKGPDDLPVNVVKILRTTNKAQTHRYVPKVYDIKNNNPYSLLRWVRRTASIEEGGFYFFGNADANGTVNSGKIMMIVPEHMVASVDQLMATIDRKGLTSTSGEKFFYFRPKYRHVSNTGESQFGDLVGALVGRSGDLEFDREANKVLVYAAPSKVADVQQWLPIIDTPPAQAMIETAVYEIYVDNESKLGLDYVAWKNGPGRNLFALGRFSERGKISELDGGPQLVTGVNDVSNKGRNASWFLNVPAAFFDFLVVKGKARVMSSAKINTRNEKSGSLQATDSIVYYRANNPGSSNDGERDAALDPDDRTVTGSTLSRSMSAYGFSYGVYLSVYPVIAENEIDLSVTTRVVNHVGFDSDELPVLTARETDSQIRCRDGQEVVIGGMTREMRVQRADKMPFLGSLPLVGYLFGGESNTVERRQVVVVLTPHVVKDYSAMSGAGTQIDAAMIRAQALDKAELKVPRTDVGFDQWLLDDEE
jgi:type II secretory pathway component GspD/PulD (secretin)